MNIFDKFINLFSDSGSNQPHTFNQTTINPSSGLPMSGPIDISGNAYGCNIHNNHSQTNPAQDYHNNNMNSAITSHITQSYDYNNNYNNPFNNY